METADLVRGFESHLLDEHAAAASREALALYDAHASAPNALFPSLATAAALGDPTIGPAHAFLVNDLLQSLAGTSLV